MEEQGMAKTERYLWEIHEILREIRDEMKDINQILEELYPHLTDGADSPRVREGKKEKAYREAFKIREDN